MPAKEVYTGPLEQVDATCWRIPKSYKQGMRVDGLIYASDKLLEQIQKDQAPEQVANVKLQRQGDQLEVTWNKARDNTLTAFYRIYAGKKLLKETPELTAKLPAGDVGDEGVSIVAVDLEGNASQPSAPAR